MTVVLFLQFAVCYLDMCLWNTNIAPAFPQAPRWWLRCPRLPMMTSSWMSQWARLHGRNTPSQARNSLKLSFIIFAGLTHGIPMHPHWHRDRRSRRWWWHLCLAWWCAGFIRFNQCLVSNYVAAYCCIIMLLKIMLLNESTKHCECYFSETKWNSQMSAPCQSDMLECKMQNTAIVYQAQLRVRRCLPLRTRRLWWG